jgi:glutaredoxin
MSFAARIALLLGPLLVALILVSACRKPEPRESDTDTAAPKSKELPALAVKADTPNLLLTWIDDQGDFHVVEKPDQVPAVARKTVRVVVTTKEAGTSELIYVANLNETKPDGTYRVTSMTRAAWDELGAARRKSRLEALAPPTGAPTQPSASAGPGNALRPPGAAVVVIIYGASWCKPCHDAERYLKQKGGVNVVMKDIEASEVAASEMKRKLERAGMPGASIPVIDVMGRILVGFSRSSLDSAIDAARSAKPI